MAGRKACHALRVTLRLRGGVCLLPVGKPSWGKGVISQAGTRLPPSDKQT